MKRSYSNFLTYSLFLGLILLGFSSCAGNKKLHPTNPAYTQSDMNAPGWVALKDTALPDSIETSLFYQNLAKAKGLLLFDYYAWIATDSLMAMQTKLKNSPSGDSLERIDGYTVSVWGDTAEVLFGKQEQKQYTGLFKVKFFKQKPLKGERGIYPQDEGSWHTMSYFAVNDAWARMQEELLALELEMNTYTLKREDTLSVYFFPGNKQDAPSLVMGAGYRLDYALKSASGEKVPKFSRRVSMHSGPVVIRKIPDAPYIFRGNLKTVVPNEVDLAQFLIFRYQAPRQYIGTRKYTFLLQWNAAENSIFADALPKGASKQELESLLKK